MNYPSFFSYKNSLIVTLVISALVVSSNVKSQSLDRFIGLYEIRGQFNGVDDDELAYVFWSGDAKVGGELTYEAGSVGNVLSISSDEKYWLNKSDDTEEYLTLHNGEIKEYYVKYRVGNTFCLV